MTRLGALVAARPLAVALVVTALVTALRMVDSVDADVAWQLWIADRIHAGAHLYRDIIEVNPPLWFWMALPVERLAAFLHLPIVPVLIAVIAILIALALAATDRLLDHWAPEHRTPFLAFAALTLAAMPWMHTGQREHIVLIGTFPYAALIAGRRENRPVPLALALSVGAGAALGFALKHYFLITPALLELWLLACLRRSYRLVRAETVAIATVGLAYAAAVVLFAPEWLSEVLPLIRLAYGATGAPALRFLFGPFAVAGLLMVALCAISHRSLARVPVAAALAVSAIGFVAAYFIQAKGWPYHTIPMVGCASIAFAALLAQGGALPRVLRLIAPAVLALPLFLAADDERHPALPSPDLLGAISATHRGNTIAFLTTEPALAWSVTLQRGYRYPSRYMGYWMMNAIIRNEALGSRDARLTALGRQIVAQTVDDYRCIPPQRIIVWRPRAGDGGFDILPFFLRDPDFAELLSHYRVRSRTSLETYVQVSPLRAPRSRCRDGI